MQKNTGHFGWDINFLDKPLIKNYRICWEIFAQWKKKNFKGVNGNV